MGRRQYAEDDADDDWDDEPSWDDDLDKDPDEDDNTVPCPHCRKQIHEDAEQCPYCERYLSEEDTVTFGKPWWVVVGRGGRSRVLVCHVSIDRGWMVARRVSKWSADPSRIRHSTSRRNSTLAKISMD